MYDENSFSADVIHHWGALSQELIDHGGLLHPQMAALGRLCLEHPDICQSIFGFLSRVIQDENSIDEIQNAVAISFMEWPELENLGRYAPLPDTVVDVVFKQWMLGGNF